MLLLVSLPVNVMASNQRLSYKDMDSAGLLQLLECGTRLTDKDANNTKLITHILKSDAADSLITIISQTGSKYSGAETISFLQELLKSKHKGNAELYLRLAACSAEDLKELPATVEILQVLHRADLDSDVCKQLFSSDLLVGSTNAASMLDKLLGFNISGKDVPIILILAGKTDLLGVAPEEQDNYLLRIVDKSGSKVFDDVTQEQWLQLLTGADLSRISDHSPYLISLITHEITNHGLLRAFISIGADLFQNTPEEQSFFLRLLGIDGTIDLLNLAISAITPQPEPDLSRGFGMISASNAKDARYWHLLIDLGADICGDETSGTTYLKRMCESLSATDLEGIFQKLPDFDINTLFTRDIYAWNAFTGDLEKTKLAIKWGADPSVMEPMSRFTALSLMIGSSEPPTPGVIELLVQNGADINHTFNNGASLLMSAANFGHPETVKVLLDNGADGSIKDTHGSTAYDWASAKVKQHPVYAELDKARYGASEREFKTLPVSTQLYPDAIAVVIGISDYQNAQIPKVDYALQDARMMKRLFIETYGIKEENVICLENASLAKLTEYFGNAQTHKGRLYNLIKPGVTDLFVYYSGHGAPVPETNTGYIVPADCDPSLLELSGYSLDIFYQNLSKLQAGSLCVIVDACFSGSSAAGMLIRNASPIYVKLSANDHLGPNAILLSSAKDNEVSSWYPAKAHSLFTYYYLLGLQGDADADHDNSITIQEMSAWLSSNVSSDALRMYNRNQTPVISAPEDKVLLQY
jgi:hypothetical protein